jgi:ribosome-binding protein aMBF1 (putative translation factor)
MFVHQDWETVVLRKSKPVQKETVNKNDAKITVSQIVNKPAWKIEQQVDGDSGKPLQFVSKEDARKIVDGRVGLKLSQKDLACKLNMPLKDIQDIESCKAVENKLVLAKIKRALNIFTK